jgi:hypothetical protein
MQCHAAADDGPDQRHRACHHADAQPHGSAGGDTFDETATDRLGNEFSTLDRRHLADAVGSSRPALVFGQLQVDQPEVTGVQISRAGVRRGGIGRSGGLGRLRPACHACAATSGCGAVGATDARCRAAGIRGCTGGRFGGSAGSRCAICHCTAVAQRATGHG